MEYITSKLTARFPDISFILEMFQEMRAQGLAVEAETKYYPDILLLAVLFRLQGQQEQEAPYKGAGKELGVEQEAANMTENEAEQEAEKEVSPDIDAEVEEEPALLQLLGHCWHRLDTAATLLREELGGSTRRELEEGVERARMRIAARLGLEESCVPKASASELCGEEGSLRIQDHCPDFVVTIDLAHKAVVLNILGSRGYPGNRGPLDFVMDFTLKTEPFMGGHAHAGILQGARNLEAWALPSMVDSLSRNPGFSLLLVGYSLGAGLAQLLAVSLHQDTNADKLPKGTKVRTVSFASPPIFRSPSLPYLDCVLDVLNHNDAISGISLRCLSRLHQRKRGLARMGIHRRTLVRMALASSRGRRGEPTGGSDEGSISEEDLGPSSDDEGVLGPSSDEEGLLLSDEESDLKEAAKAMMPKRMSLVSQMSEDLHIYVKKPNNVFAEKDSDTEPPDLHELTKCSTESESTKGHMENVEMVKQKEDGVDKKEEKVEEKDEKLVAKEEKVVENVVGKEQKVEEKEKKLSLVQSVRRSMASLWSEPVTPELWERVREELDNLPDTEYPQTGKLGSRLLVVKHKNGARSSRLFRGPSETGQFSARVRLKQGMFNDHMPYSYSAVFAGLGSETVAAGIGLEVLDARLLSRRKPQK